jgi:KaiC/GvpD/RAD55 family RecA-like ATPase
LRGSDREGRSNLRGTQAAILLILVVCLSAFPVAHAQTRTDALTLNEGEGLLSSAVIDPSAGFAYFGTDTKPGIVVKVRLSDFSRVGALTLDPGENGLRSAVIDVAGGFAYFGTYTTPGKVVKIRLANLTRVGALTLNAGEGYLTSAVIDASNGFAYFGTDTQPGIVVKVRLSDFSRVGALALRGDENNLRSAIIDTTGGMAYFGTEPGIIVKVRLSDLSRVGPLALNPGEGELVSAFIDTTGGYAYFGTDTAPGVIVKVRLSDFTRVQALTVQSGEGGLVSAAIDTARGFAYFGTDVEPSGAFVTVRLSDFTFTGSTYFRAGEELLRSTVIDSANAFAYFGTYTQPGIIVKVSLTAGPPIATSSEEVTSITSSLVVPNPAFGILGLPLEYLYGLVGAVAFVAIASSALILVKRKRGLTSNTVSMAGIASTGYADLDHVLAGGIPAGYSVLFLSPPFDERDLLFRRIIASNLSSGMQVFYVSSDIARTKDLVGRFQKGFYAFCPAATKISPGYGNLYEIPDVGNLVEFNISLNQALGKRAKESKTNVIVVDILSDVILRHRGLVSRKWFSEFTGKRKAQGFTIFGTINPLIALKEDMDRVVDLFDGVIEIYEKQDSEGRLRRFLTVKKMYAQKYSETELIIDRNKLF